MTNVHTRASHWAALLGALLLVSNTLPAAADPAAEPDAVQVPKLFQEASEPKAVQSGQGPFKTILSDSGELTIMSKRRSGFLPSRGKKDAADLDFDLDEAARLAFLNEAKRASGFLPMRGRKSSGEDFNPELVEKRAKLMSAFMPMRGRKWSGQPESADTPQAWYPRFYHPVPFGAAALGDPAPILFPSSLSRDEQDSTSLEKRKGMGFFGARGKRSVRYA